MTVTIKRAVFILRIFIVKKRTLIRVAVFIVLLAAAVIYTQVIAAEAAPVFNEDGRNMPICSIDTEKNAAAITIDTAFGDDYTDELLKILDDKGVKATFFIMGMWADKNPAKADAIAKAGHETANHSMAHVRFTDMSAEEIKDDVKKAAASIKKATGKESDLIRMPYGAFDDNSMLALKEEGYLPVKWSVDSKDWKQPGKKAVTDNVINNAKKGSIIIFQNNILDTTLALEEIIDGLQAKGLKLVTLSELLLKDDYIIDDAGVQRPFTD